MPLIKLEHLDNASQTPDDRRGLVAYSGREFVQAKFPARENLLSPWLPKPGLAMVYAERGVGKTFFALNVALAVASGSRFLRFHAERPRKVVYLDGEMPASMMQERLAALAVAYPAGGLENLLLIPADRQQYGLPDLSRQEHQAIYAPWLEGADLIIVDNLSTLCGGAKENDADAWNGLQCWQLQQRAAGRTVLTVHHAGKGGGQRGSSKKEDVLDSVIRLHHPDDYEPSEGARFNVTFEKNRGFFGSDVEPFEAWLRDGRWEMGAVLRTAVSDSLDELLASPLSTRELERITGMPRSTIARRRKAAGGR